MITKTQKQCVYVIKNVENNRIKIGIAINPAERLNQIKLAAGCELELLFCSCFYANAQILESKIHEHLRDCRYLGEWFNIEENEAIKSTQRCEVEMNGVLLEYDEYLKREIEKRKEKDKKINTPCDRHSISTGDVMFKTPLSRIECDIREVDDNPDIPLEVKNMKLRVLYRYRNEELEKLGKHEWEPGSTIDSEFKTGWRSFNSIDLSKYKRINAGMYEDRNGIRYFIRYIDKMWRIRRLD